MNVADFEDDKKYYPNDDPRLGHLKESVFICLSFSSCYKFPFHTHEQNYPWRMCRMCEESVLYSESHFSAVNLGAILIVL